MTMIRLGALAAVTSLLAGCFGSGTNISATPEAFDAAYLEAAGFGPTITPLSGTATYNGEMQIKTVDTSGETGAIRGALELTANFASASPFSATASNFSGEVNGQAVSFSGTLSSDQATDKSPINELATNPLPAIAGGGETSAMVLSLGGTLTNEDSGVKNEFRPGTNITGNFYGTDGKAVAGAVGAAVLPTGGTSVITGNTSGAVTGGQWYALK